MCPQKPALAASMVRMDSLRLMSCDRHCKALLNLFGLPARITSPCQSWFWVGSVIRDPARSLI